MKLWRSKCNQCGHIGYIFPDQIPTIKKRPELALYPYVQGDLTKGSKWFCIACDGKKSDGKDCFIYEELTGDKAKKLLDIRKRETNLQSQGFDLPQLY
jgi:hypothetical protein